MSIAVRERRPPSPLQRRGPEPTAERRPTDTSAGARPQPARPALLQRAGQSDFTPGPRRAQGLPQRQQGDAFVAGRQPRPGAVAQQPVAQRPVAQQPVAFDQMRRHQAVSQLNPTGAQGPAHNGHLRCAAAAVAGLARQHGLYGNMTDADLVQGLAQGNTSARGSNLVAVTDMLRQARLPVAGQVMMGRVSGAELDRHLAAGNKLLAQVGMPGANGANHAHYVTISGKHQGNYVVQDPMTGRSHLWSEQRLQRALSDAPRTGFVVPVGQPREAARTSQALANPSTLIPQDMSAGQYANQVLDMVRNGGPRALLHASALYRELSQSTNPKDQRAAQRIHDRGMEALDKAPAPVRDLGLQVLRQMHSSDPAQQDAGEARYRQMWNSEDQVERRAARFVLRAIMLGEPGGGYNRRGTSVGML